MRAYSVSRNTQTAAEQRMERERWMAWRIRRYGYACLTEREFEAMEREMDALSMRLNQFTARQEDGSIRVKALALQDHVATCMGITQGRVSQLLANAERAMLYFDEHDIEVRWQWIGGFWRLHAPVFKSRTSILIA